MNLKSYAGGDDDMDSFDVYWDINHNRKISIVIEQLMSFNKVIGSQLVKDKYVSPLSYGLVIDIECILKEIDDLKNTDKIVFVWHTLDIGNMLSNNLPLFRKIVRKYSHTRIDVEKSRKSWRTISIVGKDAYNAHLDLKKLLKR
jgi:hypothetical protein